MNRSSNDPPSIAIITGACVFEERTEIPHTSSAELCCVRLCLENEESAAGADRCRHIKQPTLSLSRGGSRIRYTRRRRRRSFAGDETRD